MADFHEAVELDATKATLLAHRQGSQFLECPRELTARLGVIDRQVLPTAVGHAEPIAAQMNFANARVTHVDRAVEVTDIPTLPQLTETWAGGRQLVDERAQLLIIRIANGDLAQPANQVFNRFIPIDIEFAGGRFQQTPPQEVFPHSKLGVTARGRTDWRPTHPGTY
jgi:hypothetical protein